MVVPGIVAAGPAIQMGGFALSAMAQAIHALYGMAVSINEYMDKHIEDMKRSENPTVSRAGAVLEMAKFGFGLGYVTSVIIIAAGQLVLGNTLSAVATVATAATLTNPIAMTCAAIGAIYYGWNALSDQERNEILNKLSVGLEVGISLISSVVRAVIEQMAEFSKSKHVEEFKEYVASAAEVFGKQLDDITHAFSDRFYKFVNLFGDRAGANLEHDPLIQRLRSLDENDLRTILCGGLRVDVEEAQGLDKDALVIKCSKELRSAAGSTVLSPTRGEHEFPYKQILIDVADKLSPGLSWTKFKLDDSHSEGDIEDVIIGFFEAKAKDWWAKLPDEEKEKFVSELNELVERGDGVKEVLGSGVDKKIVTQQIIENIIQAGIMHGLTKVAATGVLGSLGLSIVSQVGWLILLQTVGWIGGMKIAVFGIAGYGAFGAAVTGIGSIAIGGALSIPGLLWMADGPAYRKTIPTVIMLITRHRATLPEISQ